MNAATTVTRRSRISPGLLRSRLGRATTPPRPTSPPGAGDATTAAPTTTSPGAGSRRHFSRGELLSLTALLLGTLGFWLCGLTANGWANSFYAAAAQAGSQSWEAFFYGSSDAANSITVDKPPASLWLMSLSVRLFGLSSASILVPEVLLGVATVAVLHLSIRRRFGHAAGLLAGLTLALTPVATLMFRFDNPDALLALLVTAACAATLRACESVRARWMILAGVLLGFAFLTKTLQALLVLPVLGLVYLVVAPGGLGSRIKNGSLGLVAMVVSAGWWILAVELMPTSLRPYIGGSQDNSFLSLTFGYNGLGRLTGDEAGSVGPNMGTASLWRMFSSNVGGQISWLIPSALVFLVAGLWLTRRAPRGDLRRAAYLVWGGGLVVTGLVFSLMEGIFHEYYTVALAPFVAALVGIGAAQAVARLRAAESRRVPALTLAAATAVASVWSFVLLTRVGDVYGPLRYAVLVAGLAATLLLLVAGRLHARAVPVVLAAALFAGLSGPAAFSISTVSKAASGSIVTAGPDTGTGPGGMGGPGGPPGVRQSSDGASSAATVAGGPGTTQGTRAGMNGLLDASAPNAEVVAALQTDAEAYTWAAAAVGSQNAAGLQLGSGEPVMAVGGFNGSDPSPTLEQFQQYVADGRIHYFLASDGFGGGPGGNGGSTASSEIAAWVEQNFTEVTFDGTTFYDLSRPATTTTATSTAATTNTATSTTPQKD
ncbi:mannosyltransferase YkcB-related protein [Mobilicoccus massiliensis]|uniref:glycosyltransferase family 39 protein n=1 Tax=Mobilicoccus massiliensis TaxID=1522310 RepID=UPI0009E1F704|nr:glycosyltransferase family 39 protein [Mobilicoccus massiliensis]